MKEDEITSEIRAIRTAYANKFGNDLSAMVADIRAKQKARADRQVLPENPRRLPLERSSSQRPA